MNAPRGGRGENKIPRRSENFRGSEFLPEFDIEFASRCLSLRETRHYEALSHDCIIFPFRAYVKSRV